MTINVFKMVEVATEPHDKYGRGFVHVSFIIRKHPHRRPYQPRKSAPPRAPPMASKRPPATPITTPLPPQAYQKRGRPAPRPQLGGPRGEAAHRCPAPRDPHLWRGRPRNQCCRRVESAQGAHPPPPTTPCHPAAADDPAAWPPPTTARRKAPVLGTSAGAGARL